MLEEEFELLQEQRKQLRKEINHARNEGQKPYVVVRFDEPELKIIIKPAERALETGRIGSARGGIAWFE